MANENAILNHTNDLEEELNDITSLDELEEKLYGKLAESASELQDLKEEYEKIGEPDALGNVIKNVVWEQFMNQIAATAGEDFIEENRGLTLDLRKEAHIQTTENFKDGKIASHNTEIDYQQRYDEWQSNFQKDENGQVVTHTTRTGKEEATLVKGARKPFDQDRPSGSAKNKTDMDHTVSAGEIIRDAEANAHLTKDAQIRYANNGVDPVSNTDVDADTLHNELVISCFRYISDVLARDIYQAENDMKNDADFYITDEQISKLKIFSYKCSESWQLYIGFVL